jgi:succinate dehydrogenase / fumarate reductase cytochrome b subunit
MSYLARGPQAFNKLMHFLTSPLFRVGEVGLLALILFHLLNGLRIICFDWIDAFRYQKAFFYGLMILTFILFLFGAYPLLPKEWIGGPAR